MKMFTRIQYLFIIVGVLSSIWVVMGRLELEADFREVDLAIDYRGARTLGLQYGIGEEEIFNLLKKGGITSVVVHEDTLGALHKEGLLSIFSSNQLLERARLDTFTGFSLHPRFLKTLLRENATYIIMKDPSILRHLREILPYKVPGPITIGRERGLHVIEFGGMGERFLKIGVGFLPKRIELLSRLGLSIVIVPNNYGFPNPEAISWIFRDVCKRWGVKKILFEDEVMGYPDHIPLTLSNLQNWGLRVLVLEGERIGGMESISNEIPHLVVRTHTPLMKDEMGWGRAVAGSIRAVKEKNIRCLYLLPILEGEEDLINLNVEYVKSIKKGLRDAGFRVGEADTIQNKRIPTHILFLIGMGILFTLILLLDKVVNLSWEQRAFLLIIGGIIGCVGIWNRVFFQRFWTLGTSILFPMLGMLMIQRREGGRPLIGTIGWVLVVCGITSLGALFIVGLVSETPYLLKIRELLGVRVAIFAPILGVWVFSKWREDGVDGLLFAPPKPIHIIGLFLFAGFLLILFLETEIRKILERHLFAWFGCPVLFLTIYLFGQGYRSSFLLAIATLSQVFLIMPYLNLHTPLLLTLARSINCFAVGGAIGFLLIIALWLMGSRMGVEVYGGE